MEDNKFDEWAIVELFGHQRIVGRVTPSQIGEMLRVDVPGDNDTILYTRIINPKAIYAINPVSEEVAKTIAKEYAQPPVQRWEISNLLPEAAGDGEEDLPY